MKQYEKYKETGIEWIGEVPQNWGIAKLKYVVTMKSGNFIAAEMIEDEGIYPVYGGNGVRGYHNEYTYEGQFALIGRQGALCGNINYANGRFWPTEHAVVVLPKKDTDTIWIGELLRLMNLNQYSQASAQPGLSVEKILNLYIPLPTIKEQTAIALYLDHQTAIIDQLIQQKEKLITLLKEKRQAVINEAVTKGLNPHAKMKDTGIEWLGEVPEEWEMKKLKFIVKTLVGGGTPSTGIAEYWDGNIPWVSSKDMKVDYIITSQDYVTELGVKESSSRVIEKNSILIVVRSGILKHTFPVAINTVKVAINQDLKAIELIEGIYPNYLFWYLKGVEKAILTFYSKVGATVESIDMDRFLSLPIPHLPLSTQKEIVRHLEDKISTAGFN